MNKYKYICLDKNGFPVEKIIGRPLTNFIRILLHTRKIVKGRIRIGVDYGNKDGDFTRYSVIIEKKNGENLVVII